MTLAYRNLDTPDEKRSFPHGDMHVVTLAGTTIVRATFGPGWRWSTDAKPGAGTDSCQVAHNSYVVSGRFAVRMDDGTQAEFGPGDAAVISPGHDAWVVGDEACVLIDIVPAGSATVGGTQARMATCHPCGIEFRAERADQIDELVAAIQQHASGSHGHDVSRDHILAELVTL
jgi:predicted small metal-binding protein